MFLQNCCGKKKKDFPLSIYLYVFIYINGKKPFQGRNKPISSFGMRDTQLILEFLKRLVFKYC